MNCVLVVALFAKGEEGVIPNTPQARITILMREAIKKKNETCSVPLMHIELEGSSNDHGICQRSTYVPPSSLLRADTCRELQYSIVLCSWSAQLSLCLVTSFNQLKKKKKNRGFFTPPQFVPIEMRINNSFEEKKKK